MQVSIKLDFQDKPKFEKTPEGFLRAEATIAKAGVFPYSYSEGSVTNEAKLPEDILSKATVDSAEGVPVTNGHPTGENGDYILLNADNATKYAVGNVSKVKVVGDSIKSTITVWDAKAIADIESGKKELSIGSECTEDSNPGEFNGKKFDVSQKNIRINHVSLVDVGRAGRDVKIHMDKGDTMYKYNKFDSGEILDITDRPVLDELIALNKHVKDRDKKIKADEDAIAALKAQIASNKDPAAQADAAKLQAQLDTVTAALDEWKKKYSTMEAGMPAAVDAAAAEKVAVTDMAKSIDPNMKTDGMTTRNIKVQIVQKVLPFKPGTKVDSIDAEILQARYDAAVELSREKIKLTPSNRNSDPAQKLDTAEVEKNKASVRNAYEIERGKK